MNKHLVSSFRSTPLLAAAAAAALLLASPSLAHAQSTLAVDEFVGNSPYTFSASATYTTVLVGYRTTGVLNHGAGTLAVTDTLTIGWKTNSSGTYNLSG